MLDLYALSFKFTCRYGNVGADSWDAAETETSVSCHTPRADNWADIVNWIKNIFVKLLHNLL